MLPLPGPPGPATWQALPASSAEAAVLPTPGIPVPRNAKGPQLLWCVHFGYMKFSVIKFLDCHTLTHLHTHTHTQKKKRNWQRRTERSLSLSISISISISISLYLSISFPISFTHTRACVCVYTRIHTRSHTFMSLPQPASSVLFTLNIHRCYSLGVFSGCGG